MIELRTSHAKRALYLSVTVPFVNGLFGIIYAYPNIILSAFHSHL